MYSARTQHRHSCWSRTRSQEHLRGLSKPGAQQIRVDASPTAFRVHRLFMGASYNRQVFFPHYNAAPSLQQQILRPNDPRCRRLDATRLASSQQLVREVLQVIRMQKAWATVIAPRWPGQPWFQDLQTMLVARPFRISHGDNTMIRMGDMAEPRKNPRWDIFAWRICGDPGWAKPGGVNKLLSIF